MRVIHWFRDDLRLGDNTALGAASLRADQLTLVFVFEDRLLSSAKQGAPRVRFLRDCVERLARDCEKRGQKLVIRRGDPRVELEKLVEQTGARLLTCNRDYGPWARRRDAQVADSIARVGASLETFKDRVIWEASEIRSQQGRPYAVYSPYRKTWWKRLEAEPLDEPGPLRLPPPPDGVDPGVLPSERDLSLGEDETQIPTGGEAAAQRRLASFLQRDVAHYAETRDIPALDSTSRLSPYLRFGAISIRRCVRDAQAHALEHPRAAHSVQKWLDELVWREFYNAILDENPHVLRGAYRSEYDELDWDNDERLFAAWCRGETGYPFVDAGMRQLLATGFMHNRARMVVASFLSKDLLIDWRKGECFFMQHLVDGDPASNNGGWQWSASTGTDAQPYFRIFNPITQGERFDPDGDYVRRWVPELAALQGRRAHRPWESPLEAGDYPAPVVEHKRRRELALTRYKAVREQRAGAARP